MKLQTAENIALLPELPGNPKIWEYFFYLNDCPRRSGNRVPIREHMEALAHELGFETKHDKEDNLLITRPADPGYEKIPSVCFQGHLDMVCEAESDYVIDFTKDPIKGRIVDIDGKRYLKAIGTSLGADNGIGVALGLAVMTDPDIKFGPMECLCTTDEEIGLLGADGMPDGFFESKTMINIDSETEGEIVVGSAGGFQYFHSHKYEMKPVDVEDLGTLDVRFGNFTGGHSGVDIHLVRRNPIKFAAEVLDKMHIKGLRLNYFKGGSAFNGIPRECSFRVAGKKAQLEELKTEIEAAFADWKARKPEKEDVDAVCEINLVNHDRIEALSIADTMMFLRLIMLTPHGPLTWNPSIAGAVDTSNNVGIAWMIDGELRVEVLGRSTIAHHLDSMLTIHESLGKMCGYKSSGKFNSYGSWAPDMDSPLLVIIREAMEQVVGRAEPISIHAGLECAVLMGKQPGLDVVSVGPEIDFPHSPGEQLQIDTVPRLYEILVKVVKKLCK